MSDVVDKGAAIEGAKVDGSSRNPLKNRGLWFRAGRRMHQFVASFNVKAEIRTELKHDVARIEPNAQTDSKSEIRCERALICSLDISPAQSVGPCSGTHKASLWAFSKQTAVIIDQAHQEFVNAQAKRQLQSGKGSMNPSNGD